MNFKINIALKFQKYRLAGLGIWVLEFGTWVFILPETQPPTPESYILKANSLKPFPFHKLISIFAHYFYQEENYD